MALLRGAIQTAGPARAVGGRFVLHQWPVGTWRLVFRAPSGHSAPRNVACVREPTGGACPGDGGDPLCLREDGSSFPIELEIADLEPEGKVITFRDSTRRREHDRARAEVIAVVSHELRTPLTAIRSALGLLSSGAIAPLPHLAQRMLEIGVGNADRLIRLVKDLLDLERVEAGHNSLHLVPCDAGLLMHESADGVQALADQAGVMLNVVPVDGQINGDPDRLQQVLTNLLASSGTTVCVALPRLARDSSAWLQALPGDDEIAA